MTQQLFLPGELIKKSNVAIRSKFKIDDVAAARIFASIIACIRTEDEDFQEYTILANSVISHNSGKEYQLVKNALKTITSTVIEIPHDNSPNPDFTVYPLFTSASYKKGQISAKINPDLKPHFINLSANFTSISLMKYLGLSTVYSQRLYEILQSYRRLPEVSIQLENLYFMLNVPQSLKRYPDFRRFILERGYKEIRKKTGFNYEWEAIKKGRSIYTIRFIFAKNRALPVAKAKENDDKEKQAQANNVLWKLAYKCWTDKKKVCTVHNNKKMACELCLRLIQQN